MNIAFFHELHFGGARRVVGEYGKVMRNNHVVDLFYSTAIRENDFEKIFHNTHWYKYVSPTYSGNSFLTKLYKDFIEPIKLYFHHKKIAREIDKKKYDFVFVHLSQYTHAPFILRFLKTPSVYFCHEPLRIAHDSIVSIPEDISLIKRVYERIIRRVKKEIDASNIKHANLVLANCKYSQKNIKKAYGIKSFICYLGVDKNLFKPIKIKKEYDLLFVGSDVWMEGFDTLQEINKIFNYSLKIHVIKKQKGKYISDNELVNEYNKAKLVIVLGRFDPFSMIPLEAMACKVPPLVVNEGGPVEAVQNGIDGFLIERDPQQFAKKIKELLENDTKRKIIGNNGRKKIESFWNWEKSTERLLNILRTQGLISV